MWLAQVGRLLLHNILIPYFDTIKHSGHDQSFAINCSLRLVRRGLVPGQQVCIHLGTGQSAWRVRWCVVNHTISHPNPQDRPLIVFSSQLVYSDTTANPIPMHAAQRTYKSSAPAPACCFVPLLAST